VQGSTTFTDMFSYTQPGQVAGKRLRVTKTAPYPNGQPLSQTAVGDLNLAYAYNYSPGTVELELGWNLGTVLVSLFLYFVCLALSRNSTNCPIGGSFEISVYSVSSAIQSGSPPEMRLPEPLRKRRSFEPGVAFPEAGMSRISF